MASLAQISEQIRKTELQMAELQRQADAIRMQEKQQVIAEVVAKIAEYGLTASDLRLGVNNNSRRAPRAKSKEKAAARYRSPTGETWSGGRGRKPGWITAALAAGKDLTEFEIR